MSRKFRITETSGKATVGHHGQHVHYHLFCVNCHGLNHHYPTCHQHESYAIPTTAEVPPKKANHKIWSIFKKQFVFIMPQGWWAGYADSWWNRIGHFQATHANPDKVLFFGKRIRKANHKALKVITKR
jgi:hypothetical protein